MRRIEMYTSEEYKTYLKVKRALLLEDARNYTRDYLENTAEWAEEDITEEQFESIDFESMVNDFETHVDYFDPTADIWHGIVENYFEDFGL
jgi:hypothetical protein